MKLPFIQHQKMNAGICVGFIIGWEILAINSLQQVRFFRFRWYWGSNTYFVTFFTKKLDSSSVMDLHSKL